MNIPENTSLDKRSRSAKKYAAAHRRKIDRIDSADWKSAHYTDPSTGRVRTINVRHA